MKLSINSKINKSSGLTLFELLVVLTILSFLATIVGPKVVTYLGKAKSDVARSQLSNLGTSLELFFLDNERYPNQEEGLKALTENISNLPFWDGPYLKDGRGSIDPWGRAYIYHVNSESESYQIGTFGRDGQKGGSKEDEDIFFN